MSRLVPEPGAGSRWTARLTLFHTRYPYLMGLLVLFAVALILIIAMGTVILVGQMRRPMRRTYAFAIARQLPVDPGQLNLRWHEQTVRHDDGTAAPAWIIEGEKPDGPRIVLTHGWANSRYGALPKAPLYVPHASQIIVYDLRGHGDSTARTTTLGVREADDLLALLDQLNSDGKGVMLVGSSMGAVVTLLAAARLSQENAAHHLAGVILDGPYCSQMEPVINHLRRDRLPAQPVAWLAHQILRMLIPGYGRYDATALASALTCPVLVMHGCDDPICSIESGRAIAQAAREGELVAFEDAGHGGLWHHDPPRYRAALAAFMEKVEC